jgi:hypothetical protein
MERIEPHVFDVGMVSPDPKYPVESDLVQFQPRWGLHLGKQDPIAVENTPYSWPIQARWRVIRNPEVSFRVDQKAVVGWHLVGRRHVTKGATKVPSFGAVPGPFKSRVQR